MIWNQYQQIVQSCSYHVLVFMPKAFLRTSYLYNCFEIESMINKEYQRCAQRCVLRRSADNTIWNQCQQIVQCCKQNLTLSFSSILIKQIDIEKWKHFLQFFRRSNYICNTLTLRSKASYYRQNDSIHDEFKIS